MLLWHTQDVTMVILCTLKFGVHAWVTAAAMEATTRNGPSRDRGPPLLVILQ